MNESVVEYRFTYWVLVFYMFIVYSGLPDYISIVRIIRPGLLSVVLITLIWITSKSYKRDLKETEIIVLFLIVLQSIISFTYAANIGYTKRFLETEILLILGLTVGPMLAIRSIEGLEKFTKLWLILGLLVAAQVINNGGVGPLRLGDENDVTLTMVLIFPFFYYGLSYFKGFYRFLCVAGLVFTIAAIVIAQSRGGFLALAAAIATIVFFSPRRLRLIFMGGIALIVVAIFLVPEQYLKQVGTITDTKEATADSRLYSWGLGIDMFLDNPIMGVGTAQYGWNAAEYQRNRGDLELNEKGLIKRRNMTGRSSHSTYIDYLSEKGIVGLVLIIALSRGIYKRLKRLRQVHTGNRLSIRNKLIPYFSYAISCGIIGNMTGAAFVGSFYFPNFWLVVGWVIAVDRISMSYGSKGIGGLK